MTSCSKLSRASALGLHVRTPLVHPDGPHVRRAIPRQHPTCSRQPHCFSHDHTITHAVSRAGRALA